VERWRVVRDGAAIDGITCDHYWEIEPPVLTADGAHVAYVCPTPSEPGTALGLRWVVLDGRRFGPYADTWTLGLSPDGAQVAYGAAESLPVRSWRAYVNGIPRTQPKSSRGGLACRRTVRTCSGRVVRSAPGAGSASTTGSSPDSTT